MTSNPASGPPRDHPVLVETSRELPLVTLTIALRTGAQSDPPGLDGLSHLLGRLMRRTGGGIAPHELDAQIDTLGASVGIDVGHSSLAFHATVISRSFDRLLDLVAGMLARPELEGEELERLRRETLSELVDVLDNDRALVRRWFRRHFFGDHPYGRSSVGTMATVKRCTGADLSALHSTVVTPDNLVFAYAGDVDTARARQATASLQQELPARPAPSTSSGEPTVKPGRRLLVVDKPDRTQTQILIGTLGTHALDADHCALLVANTVFGGTFSARLTREIRGERGWSYGAYSSLPIDRHRQAFSMWTFPKSEDAAPCIRHQLAMLDEWCSKGISQAELDWAKSYLVRSHAFAIDTASKRVGLALDEEIYGLPRGYHADYVERIESVSLDEANAAVAHRIDPTNLSIVVVGTAARIQTEIEQAIPRLESANVVPFDADP